MEDQPLATTCKPNVAPSAQFESLDSLPDIVKMDFPSNEKPLREDDRSASPVPSQSWSDSDAVDAPLLSNGDESEANEGEQKVPEPQNKAEKRSFVKKEHKIAFAHFVV
jgi:hypothetical protein